ncbi:MAG: glycerol-3-phosphate dehydrogenase, partial [Chloroflexi bacterium]|nr:glycerol-3-phosphate dehydrogenase [Chloroflexota bacterium]
GPAAAVQAALQNQHFKVETTTDVVGVEIAATLKNAYAIALGMCDGLGLTTNTKAFIVTLGLAEMAAIIDALGGQLATAYGLAGLGDLLTTGFSPHGRNRTLGEKLCRDPDWREFVRTHTVEGIAACRAARDLARRHGIRTPLLDTVYDVLFEDLPPPEEMSRFLREFFYE